MATPLAHWAAPVTAAALALAVVAAQPQLSNRAERSVPEAVLEAKRSLESDRPAEWATALQDLQRAIARNPRSAESRDGLLLAIRLCERLLAEQPDAPHLLLQYGFRSVELAQLDRIERPTSAKVHLQAAYDALVRLRIHAPGHPAEPALGRAISQVASQTASQNL